MKVDEWEALLATINDEIYADLVTSADCGAFDGGCLVVAQALQKVIGGEIVVLIRDDDHADHAAVFHEGRLWDYAGPLLPEAFIDRFNSEEMSYTPWRTVGWRQVRDGDLKDAVRDDKLSDRLSAVFRRILSDNSDPAPPSGISQI
jgi:hypothetical protein